MYKLCLECKKREGECKCKEPIFETIFEYAPQGIPPLNEEQWKALHKETPEQKKRRLESFKRARELFKNHPL